MWWQRDNDNDHDDNNDNDNDHDDNYHDENDDKDDDLTFSHDKETKKQDHGVARKDKVAAIFLKNILLNLSLNALY